MTKDWKEGYNFALKEIESFIYFINGGTLPAVSFRTNNGSKGVTDEILDYLEERKRKI